MYDPKSMKAEEFISHEEILESLAYADQNKNNAELIGQLLEKARQYKGLSHREALLLLDCELPDKNAEIFALAEQIKKEFYGSRIVMFAPLYLSNYCVNGCVYCPYHAKNKHIARKKLTQEEIVREVTALQDMGHKRLAIEAGEDPKYILRRLTRFAVEDVSLADPNAVTQAIACWETYDRLGSPEGDLAVFQLTAYLATAPKSVGVYKAMYAAKDLARKTGSLMPPKNILNAPTKLMKQLGYSEGYEYDPDTEDGFSGANYFPDGVKRVKLYHPVERGFEREIKRRVDYFDNLRREKQKKKGIEDA